MPIRAATLLVLAGCTLALAFAPTPHAPHRQSELRADPDRIEERIFGLTETGADPGGGVTRLAFSAADVRGRDYVVELMRAAGLEPRIDAAGNIFGRREGTDASLAPILLGSHIDSVPRGGSYDGDVGVIGAIECVQVLAEAGITTRHPLEVVVFADEEGAMTGSRALIGDLGDAALAETTAAGSIRREGIRTIGGAPERIDRAERAPGTIAAFLELHVEQGGHLDATGIDIGVVEGIVGIEWWDVTIEGMANHAGTTPMDQRSDALLAAADYVLAVNEIITAEPGRQVGTVGKIRAEPGAHNVIPGRVQTSLEIRDLSQERIWSLFERIARRAEQIGNETGTTFTFTHLDASAVPATMDEQIREVIAAAAEALGLTWASMPSGAGHDAQNVAKIAPTGMIFVPSETGISHSPREHTSKEDMANGANVLLHALLALDRTL